MKRIVPIILFLILSSCSKDYKTMVFSSFEITVPQSWSKLTTKGIDSEVGGILTNTGDTLVYDLGWYTFDPENEDSVFEINLDHLNNWQPEFEGQVPDSLLITNVVTRHRYSYEKIGCRNAKFITPIDTIGIYSGVFIDSISVSSQGVMKFGLYGEQLNKETEKQFFDVIRTISFREYCK